MRIRWMCLFCLLLAATLGCVWAQVASSRLEGVVRDESGAVVPRAGVTATNNRTQATQQTVTNAEGVYVFPSLLPGRYTVSAEAPGFRKSVHTSVRLDVSATVAEHFQLLVGQVTESVAVEASAERPAQAARRRPDGVSRRLGHGLRRALL